MATTKVDVNLISATGTPGSGNFLRGDGTWNGAGAMTLVATVTATDAASADFDGSLTSTYDQYLMIGSNIHVDTDTAFIWVRCDVNGGDSFDSGGSDYAWDTYATYATTEAAQGDTADSEISLTGDSSSFDWSNESTHAEGFALWLYGPSNTTFLKLMHWTIGGMNTTTSPTLNVALGSGAYIQTAAYDSIQVLPSTGTIDGTFRLYGLANS